MRRHGLADRRVVSPAGALGCSRQRMMGNAVHQLALCDDLDGGGVVAEGVHPFGKAALLRKGRPGIGRIAEHAPGGCVLQLQRRAVTVRQR